MIVLELCKRRVDEPALVTVMAPSSDRLELAFTVDAVRYMVALSRGDIAMLRGMLANLAEWERGEIARGALRPLEDQDRPAGMNPYFFERKDT